jgi:Na+-translocating ferredoxin:NAD+ oxidoreductase RNF subunit RnfB
MFVLLVTIFIGILGLLVGLLLGVFSEVFKVETDEKVALIRDALPGNNCGGCGYPGCDGLASAIAKGEAKPNACPVGGLSAAEKISAILGVSNEVTLRKVAVVKCMGSCKNVERNYDYHGSMDCFSASLAANRGDKACFYACIGYGSCAKVCKFGALFIEDGLARVDKEKCTGCGACVKTCPLKLISLVPYDKKSIVLCSSYDKGQVVNKTCKVGCIACGICQKNCPDKAIEVKNNLAIMDYEKCSDCGICSQKCPRKIIS